MLGRLLVASAVALTSCDTPKPAARSEPLEAKPAKADPPAKAPPAPVEAKAPAEAPADPDEGEPPDVSGLPVPPIGEKPKPGPIKGTPKKVELLSPVERWGWTKDGQSFYYCVPNDGPGDCRRVPVDGKPQNVRKLPSGLDKGATTWAYGDIEITSHVKEPTVHVGGRVGSGRGKPNVFAVRFKEELERGADYVLEVVSVSPRGKHMVFLVHAELGHAFVEVEHKLTTTKSFAATVYSATGFNHLRAEKFEGAERWFSRAAAIGDHWKHPYNLACARARGKLGGVETALRNAVSRGGDPVKAKAKRDKDLASVRGQEWFTTLVGES